MSILKPFKKNKKSDIAPKKPDSEKQPKKTKEKVVGRGIAKDILKKIGISEKTTDLNKKNQYVFFVQITANKEEIKKEVNRRYGVKVKAVNIIRMKGKMKRVGNKFGRRSSFKKAIITLKPGYKIEII